MQTQMEQSAHAQTRPCPTLVLGLGNILLRDEGVGVHVVQALEERALPTDVELFDGATAGIDLLDTIADRRKVIVIDAISGSAEPGTVLRLSPADLLPRETPSVSLHELGFLETLTIAGLIGAAPAEVVIIGVKPYSIECGLELSPELKRLVPRIIDLVLAELESAGEDRP